MKIFINKRVQFFIAILLLLLFNQSKAKSGIVYERLTGSDLSTGASFIAYTDVMQGYVTHPAAGSYWVAPNTAGLTAIMDKINSYDILQSKAVIKLRIKDLVKEEGDMGCFPDNFTYTVVINYKKFNLDGTYDNNASQAQLSIEYKKGQGFKYKNLDVLQFNNVALLSCNIASISTSNPSVDYSSFVELAAEIEHNYIPKPAFFTKANQDVTIGSGSLLSLVTPQICLFTPFLSLQFDNGTTKENIVINATVREAGNTPLIASNTGYGSLASFWSTNKLQFDNWVDSIEIQWTITEDEYFEYNNSLNGFKVTQVTDEVNVDYNKYAVSIVLPFPLDPNGYKISNIFEKGVVAFRARFIGSVAVKDGAGNIIDTRMAQCPWSGELPGYPAKAKIASNNAEIFAYTLAIRVDDYNAPFNWIYNCTYAEDGKKKESISYFDGTLKSRQTIAKFTTNDFALIKETIYDFQGRPAIEILPVPTQPNSLNYVANFNISATGVKYQAASFDYNTSACTTTTNGMLSTSGAAQYYSNNNAWLGGNSVDNKHQYIPMSGSGSNNFYPFMQTVYTPDNTGRVSLTTQVGEAFKLGSGKETKYFYSRPDQSELDRLFGAEVGFASHYTKEMVRDANGQFSVAIKDAGGKVIVTALAGDAPAKLQPLASAGSTQVIEADLLEYGQSEIPDGYLLTSPITIIKDQDYEFKYSLSPETYSKLCNGSTLYCLDCIYDLEISIVDECGQEYLKGDLTNPTVSTPIIRKVGPASINGVCESGNTGYNISQEALPQKASNGNIKISLPKGNYFINRKITVNSEARENYLQNVVAVQQCKTLAQFEAEEGAKVNLERCHPCEAYNAAKKKGGDVKQHYINDVYTARFEQDPNVSTTPEQVATRKAAIGVEFDLTKTNCDIDVDPCEVYKAAILSDVAPHGLYGNISLTVSTNYSVFIPKTGAPYYQDIPYFSDPANNIGEHSLNSFTLEQLANIWKPEYSVPLMPLHPEYYQYQACRDLEASRNYDLNFTGTADYTEAKNLHYMDNISTTDNKDPFVINGLTEISTTPAQAFKNYINTTAFNGLQIPSVHYVPGVTGLKSFVAYAVFCKDAGGYTETCITDALANIDNCDYKAKNLFWHSYKTFYQAIKTRAYETYIADYRVSSAIVPTLSYSYSTMYALLDPNNVRFDKIKPAIDFDKGAERKNKESAIISNCEQTCENMADGWISQLSNCTFSSDENTKKTQIATLKAALVAVCKNGCDINNPFGASSVKPGSANIDRSFEDVFVRLGYAYSENCNADLITFPKPYDENGKMTDAKNNPVAQLQSDLCAIGINPCIMFGNCNETLTSSETSACSILDQSNNNDIKKLVNAFDTMTCENGNCFSCSKFRELYQEYYNKSEVYMAYNTLASFINKKIGFNLEANDYADFMAKCLGYNSTPEDVGNGNPYFTLEAAYRQAYLIYRPTPTSYTYAQLNKEKYYDVWSIDTKLAQYHQPIQKVYSSVTLSNPLTTATTAQPILTASIDGGAFEQTNKEKGFLGFNSSVSNNNDELTDENVVNLDKANNNALYFATEENSSLNTKASPLGITKIHTVNIAEICTTLDYLVGKYFGYDTYGSVSQSQYDALFDNPEALQGVAVVIMNWYAGPLNTQDKLSIYITENHITNWQQLYNQLKFLLCQCNKVSSEKCNAAGVQCSPCMQFQKDLYENNIFATNPVDGSFSLNQIFNSTIQQSTLLEFYNVVQQKCYANQFPQIASGSVNYETVELWLKDILCKCGISKEYCAEELVKCRGGSTSTSCSLPNNRVLALQSLLQEIVRGGGSCALPPPGSATHNKLAGTYKCFALNSTNITALFGGFIGGVPSGTELTYNATTYNAGSIKEVLARFILSNGGSIDERKTIKLSMVESNTNIDFSKIDHIYELLPVYLPNTSTATNWFVMRARAKFTITGKTYAKTVYINGYFEDPITRAVSCSVKCAKLCRKPQVQVNACEQELLQRAKDIAYFNYQNAIKNTIDQERINYNKKCLSALKANEQFKKIYNDYQHHYTLYYYDAAGNLVKTVPPKGVVPLDPTATSAIHTARLVALANYKNKDITTYTPVTVPGTSATTHVLVTQYQYNTLNQLVWQQTPDAGISQFGYDRLGRLIVSQNAKQSAKPDMHSYTLYDKLGRIKEVGEVENATLNGVYNNTDVLDYPVFITNNIETKETKSQITRTYYDSDPDGGIQYNLNNTRGRVTKVAYFAFYPNSTTDKPNQAVMYSYDIHGNVKQLFRYVQNLEILNQDLKVVDYDFDVISGKVESVSYQQGKLDQYIHHYKYDAENRLVGSYSAPRQELVDNYVGSQKYDIGLDASYDYYYHGPLARTELGELKVQGLDYAYTLQGWLKGVNSISLQTKTDMGKDGFIPSGLTNKHTFMGRDEYGFMLNYYEGDYQQIQSTELTSSSAYPTDWLFNGVNAGSFLATNQKSLYNGNISQMVTAIGKFMGEGKPLAGNYEYDQLNRIISAKYVNNFDAATNTWQSSGSYLTDWQNTFTYDANGNILSQERNGSGTHTAMDNLTYSYYANTNQLEYVHDNVTNTGNYTDDVDNQSSQNYQYDEIGNLKADDAEDIEIIEWNLYGKIKKITRKPNSGKPDIEYEYSPDGFRTVKVVKPSIANAPTVYTYYMRDAQGNILATYEREFNKTINYEVIDYADLNSKLGVNGLAAFMTATHTSATYSGLHTALYNDISSDITYQKQTKYLSYVGAVINDYLVNAEDISVVNNIIASYSNADFLVAYDNYQGFSPLDLCGKMAERHSVNNNFENFASFILSHTNTRNLFLDRIATINYSLLQDILDGIGINASSVISDDLTNIEQFLNSDPGNLAALITACDNQLSILNCNGLGGEATGVLNYLYYNNAEFKNTLLTIPEFKELFYLSGNGSVNFSADQLEAYDILNALLYYEEVDYKSIAIPPSRFNNYLAWSKNNYPNNFIYVSTLVSPAALATYQNTHNLYNTVSGSNGVESYFTLIKNYFGQSYVEQLLNGYYPASNQKLYADNMQVKEWHIYGSSRLGIYKANTVVASRKAIDTNNDGVINASDSYVLNSGMSDVLPFNHYSQVRGNRNYELCNHLGNVMVVVSDKKQFNCVGQTIIDANFDAGSYNNIFPVSGVSGMTLSGNQLNVTCIANNAQVGGLFDVEGPAGTYQVDFDVTKSSSTTDVWFQVAANYNTAGGGVNQYTGYAYTNGHYTFNFTSAQGMYRFKFGADNTGSGSFTIDNLVVKQIESPGFKAEVLAANDYSAFGAPMPGRSFKVENAFVKNTVSTGNFSSGVDGWVATANATVSNVYGNIRATVTALNAGMQKTFSTEPGKTYRIRFKVNLRGWPYMYVKDVAGSNNLISITEFMTPGDYSYTFRALGFQTNIIFHEAGNAAGSVQIASFVLEEVDVENAYRFGAGTQEKDDEIFAGAYTAEYWEYDSRLGRRWNVDPVVYADQSGYAVFNNCPIEFNDPLGLTGKHPQSNNHKQGESNSKGTATWDTENGWVTNDPVIVRPKSTSTQVTGPIGGTLGGLTLDFMFRDRVDFRNLYYNPNVSKIKDLWKSGMIRDGEYAMSRYKLQAQTKAMYKSAISKLMGELPPTGKPLWQQKQLAEDIASGVRDISKNAGKTRSLTSMLSTPTATKVIGRTLFVVSASMSIYTVWTAEDKARAITTEASGWAGAWGGAAIGAGWGAAIGGPFAPITGAIGGIVGGGIGYFAGSETSGAVYDSIKEK